MLNEMIRHLRSRVPRCRTGILLMPAARLSEAPDLAAMHNIGAVNMAETYRASRPPGARFAGITSASLGERLSELASECTGADCVLVLNLDLLIARLSLNEREALWRFLRDDFVYRQRALVLAMPVGAEHLLPRGGELQAWEADGRCLRIGEDR